MISRTNKEGKTFGNLKKVITFRKAIC